MTIKAQENMGLMFERGDGVPQNDNESHYWYQEAETQSANSNFERE